MVATKASLFQGAQRLLKDRKLSTAEITGNTREPARILNDIWDSGAVDDCLQSAQWKFGTRTIFTTASPSIEPDFGYQFAFDKPTDWIRTTGVWMDAMMNTPLTSYRDEAGYLFSSLENIYFSYISNDAQYGGDLSLWPPNFVRFVEAHLAAYAAGPLTERGRELWAFRKMMLSEASATDAMSDPTKHLPIGSWVKARLSGGYRSNGQPR